jgi:hypothetical protein
MGRTEFNRSTAYERTRFNRDGIRDVSPKPTEIMNAFGNANDDDIAAVNRDVQLSVTHDMIGRVLQRRFEVKLVDGQVLWFQGFRTGHGDPAETALRDLKTRSPRTLISMASVLSADRDKRELLPEGHKRWLRLKDAGIIDTVYMGDNNSPFALRNTLEVQDKFLIRGLASLTAAQAHFSINSSLGEIGRRLGEYAAFVGVAAASHPLVVEPTIPGWNLLRKTIPSLPQRGGGSVQNCIIEAQQTTIQALTDRDSQLIEETIDLEHKPVFICYTVPIQLWDRKAWLAFSSEIRRWLGNHYPTAVPIFSSGSGSRDPSFNGSAWLQTTVFFPMPDLPYPIKTLMEGEGLHRRKKPAGKNTKALSERGNGHRPKESLQPDEVLVSQSRGKRS